MRSFATSELLSIAFVSGAIAWNTVAAADEGGHAPVRVSGLSPYSIGCNGEQPGTLYRGAEVEPHLAANPVNPRNLVAVWQQDRWSNGGADGLVARYSTDGGKTWLDSETPPFSLCAGGTEANLGNFDRASDPWVSFAPNGDVYFAALAFDLTVQRGGVLVSKSTDGGRSWGPITQVILDTDPLAINDKESITADALDSSHAYAAWNRLYFAEDGTILAPAYFARTVDGGASWEAARPIFDPGPNNEAHGNVVHVLPDGALFIGFNLITNIIAPVSQQVALLHSSDKGVTWSPTPTIVNELGTVGVIDPRDGHAVRTASILPVFAVDPRPLQRAVYAVWQDARFSGGLVDQIVLARSSDGGVSWSEPALLSAPGDVQAFTPSLHVDGHGVVTVTYFDFTFATDESGGLATDYWMIRSFDGGTSFGDRRRITGRSFDMSAAPDANGYFIGDYVGLAGVDGLHTLIVDTNPGEVDDSTDVYSLRLPELFHGPGPAQLE
jgi:hypothetical protein